MKFFGQLVKQKQTLMLHLFRFLLSFFILGHLLLFINCFGSKQIIEKKPDSHIKPIVIPPQYLKPIIGRVEWVEFPNWKLKLRARVDTGAKSCSIHAVNIEKVTENGEVFVLFDTFVDEKPVRLKSKFVKEAKVTSTSGVSENRIIISEMMKMGKYKEEVIINLNDRTNLTYPILIGRNYLMGKFLVDVSLSHALGD
ncbi:RimK/LysX family protein [Leptospira bandrabouensis]|nr:RimK/LysX family protein [Leptospira bandrabouensis]MCG6143373.1 RimK/LysX family protein [Leptospira bandrabouensis]MCG6151590.1 RimK/LysX family protein [Leptospira bandrabouensis]MCG6159033.1 RimK/LysX family protein [Leptospira bandrabouensis]MCG6162967.1 RimK/LysX family protein [Leptospira bandrabouensis]MCW7458182.1 RimK/LysX family protein [Leptospira bandrabouensis]